MPGPVILAITANAVLMQKVLVLLKVMRSLIHSLAKEGSATAKPKYALKWFIQLRPSAKY
ncbi:hypothetical protein D3C86_2154520 [compost metagenome]